MWILQTAPFLHSSQYSGPGELGHLLIQKSAAYLVLFCPHGTLLWICVFFFSGSQQCLALDDAFADLWDVVIKLEICSLGQSFRETPADALRGSTSWTTHNLEVIHIDPAVKIQRHDRLIEL